MRVSLPVILLLFVVVFVACARASVIDTRPQHAFLGDGNVFVVRGDGALWAWGNNNGGQLGDGTAIIRYTPVLIMDHSDILGGNFSGVVEVRSGPDYTLALKDDGTVWSTGDNDLGQLGDRNRTGNTFFALVPNLSPVTDIAAGEYHAVVLANDGMVWTWGDNGYGQLGNGSTKAISGPVRAQGLIGIKSVAAGARHSVATRGLETYAWGDNKYGQLGDNSTKARNTPVKVPITGVITLTAGEYHTLALMDDSVVMAWGGNDYGQLGNNAVSQNGSVVPVLVKNLSNVKQIAAAGRYSLALRYDGTVWAWGYNGNGILGNWATDKNRHPEPMQVKGLYDIVSIQATPTGCLATDIYDNVWAWGGNEYGQLGDGTRTSRYSPFPWVEDLAPWWAGFDAPATPTPTPTSVPTAAPTATPTPAPAPGLPAVAAALAAGFALARRTVRPPG